MVKKVDKKKDAALKQAGHLIPNSFYRKQVVATEKKFALTASGLKIPYRLSFGLLSFNLWSTGGIVPGNQVQISGREGSGKSTLCAHVFAAALADNTPIINYHDPEGALNETMFKHIARRDLGELFQGEERAASYYDEQGLELFYDVNRNTLKALPDKVWDNEKKKWYYVFNADKAGREMMTAAGFSNKDYVPKRYQETGRLWVETDDARCQAVIMVDSYPALLTEKDDDDEGSAAMALDARAFSKNVKRVKGRLKRKASIVLGVNQIRENPGVRYGCLHGDTIIPFVDGRQFTIREIVKDKIKGKVWSYNEDLNIIEPKSITDFHFNGKVEEKSDWLTITSTKAVDTKNGVISVTVTPDHKLFTNKGWKKAKNITLKHKLISKKESIINGTLAEFLYGTLLGDSHLVKDGKNNARLRIRDNSNINYSIWKAKKLKALDFVEWSNGIYSSGSFSELLDIKNKLGDRSPKNIMHRWTNLSMAIHYMDDGHLKRGNTPVISFKRFKNDEDTLNYIIEQYNRLGINCTIWGEGAISIDNSSRDKFFKAIRSFVPSYMQYKLPKEHKDKYKEFELKYKNKTITRKIEITDINVGSDRKFRAKDKYDISVEDNENYLAGNVSNGIIVHNSPEYEPGGNALKFHCMTGDTLLLGEYGFIEAKDYNRDCAILGKNRLETPVIFKSLGKKPVASLKLESGMTLRGSHNHAVYTYSPMKGLKFRKLKNINYNKPVYVSYKIGQDVWSEYEYAFENHKIHLNSNVQNIISLPDSMNPDLARLLGYLVGDGSIMNNNITHTTGHKKEHLEVQELMDFCFGGIKESYKNKQDNTYTITYNNSMLGQWLRINGFEHHGRDKTIPECMMQSTKESITSFLSGLFDADGCLTGKNLTFHTISFELAKKVQLLLMNMGIDCKLIDKANNGFGGKLFDKHIYVITLYGNNITKFLREIPTKRLKNNITEVFSDREKAHSLPPLFGWRGINKQVCQWVLNCQNNIKKLSNKREYYYSTVSSFRTKHQRESIVSSLDKVYKMVDMHQQGFRWSKITDIQLNGEPEEMYDGTMQDQHTIITNGIVSHNSDVRFQVRAVGVPDGYPIGMTNDGEKTKEFSTERSIYGKNKFDNYKYINVKNTKNKGGVPYMKGKMRILFEDGKGRMLGYDPVYDTLEYLRQTGRVKGSFKKGFQFNVPELDKKIKGFSKKTWDYLDFKLLIIGEALREKDILAQIKKKFKCKPVVRKHLFSEMKDWDFIQKLMDAAKNAREERRRKTDDVEADSDD